MHYIKKYQDAVLIACALCLLGIIAGSYIWGIGNLIEKFNRATNSDAGGSQAVDFRIEEAKKALSSRGIVVQ